jgi:RNase H-fold protein (predicted Holliday junction resolvase)
MTTVEARQALFEEMGYKGLTKANIDSMAAKLITEQWMSEHQMG